MTPDQAATARHGLAIAAAYLDGDGGALDERLAPFLTDDAFPKLVECFLLAGVLMTGVAAKDGARMPFDTALDQVEPLEDALLLEDLPAGPWGEITALARAYQTGGGAAARAVPLTMDLPSAVNAAFRFMISALAALNQVAEFRAYDGAGLARLLIGGIDGGHATA